MSAARVVLVVEDDLDIRETVIDALLDEGYTAIGAVDGVDALQQLRAMQDLPELILLDLMMPRMNGMEFCAEKNADPRWSAIPIVILSADAQAAQRAQACGAADCLRKPVKLDMLYATVSRFVAP